MKYPEVKKTMVYVVWATRVEGQKELMGIYATKELAAFAVDTVQAHLGCTAWVAPESMIETVS